MWRHLQFSTIFFAPVVAFLLAGVENIGIMIENPMRILPMAAYCASIHTSIMYVGADWAAGNYVRFPVFQYVCFSLAVCSPHEGGVLGGTARVA